MSCKVLVIPEDPALNGYILRPLVQRVLAEVGRPNARIQILTNPRLRGYEDAVAVLRNELVKRYSFFDLWVFVPDADRAQEGVLRVLEASMKSKGVALVCCPAQPELEAWLIAGHLNRVALPWDEIRNHPRLKEEVMEPFLAQHGDPRAAGQGRQRLMLRTLEAYRGLKQRCPEIENLETRIRVILGAG